ncbi:TonB-dependent receptor [Asticcacaulis sp. BYS171W]|uniref:TonB-dependent receptor n=1 Tax=Asticcacaulis aquaticus TaxID=2984212 RepID=A0ABT5HW13_9CAUL|nr:TonB-dependent receptor [Asticcacaulis aquaticus]MDC7684255.1 TonB-dependent receptor [Asticcacaulis aquaticus]
MLSTTLRALAAGAATALVMSSPAYAQAAKPVDIAPQSLISALEQYGRQSGVELMFDRSQLGGKTTSGVKGTFTPNEALRRLLEGTNATLEQVNGTTFLIKISGQKTSPRADAPDALPQVLPVRAIVAEDRVSVDGVQEVVVVGARRAQQSAIDRKKRSNTAQDSIVADDVGSFPDRNLNEALSRIPGAALSRDETGEGSSINIRGNGGGAIRIEMDGMGVATNGADLAINGSNGGGRGSDMRELPADLIKSVDVIKGNTPDLTEGGLGASVQIKTRDALDFSKPYFQMRVAGERNSLSEKWSPNINIIASRKFFDNRLGVLLNFSQSERLGDSHKMGMAGTNDRAGYLRTTDFDNSPEKTYSLNPATVSGEGLDTPVLRSPLAANTSTFFDSSSRRQIIEKSAAAKSKADCVAAFPLLTAAELNAIQAGSNNANRSAAQAQRISEQQSCLNQWNDYAPNSVRDQRYTAYEDRLAWDVRFDFRVNDHLKVYAKYQVADRYQEEDTRFRSRGGVSVLTAASTGFVTQSLNNNTNIPVGSSQVLTPVAGGGYWIYNPTQVSGGIQLDANATSTTTNYTFPILGQALNVNPATLVMDDNHHITQMDITNATLGIDHIRNRVEAKSNYVLVGGEYKDGPLLVTFQANQTESSYSRTDRRVARTYNYGNARMRLLPSGMWTYDLPADYNENDMANFVKFNPVTAGLPLTRNFGIQLNPRMTESSETAGKIDASYNLKGVVPFFTRVKTGASYRDMKTAYWSGGGFQPVSGVEVPTLNLRGNVRACENLPTTTVANQCVYGYVPDPSARNRYYGVETITQAQAIAILQQSLEENSDVFFNGYDGAEGMTNWTSIDADKFYALVNSEHYNLDCMKVCEGSDGKMYAQPVSKSTEQITAAYYMAEFEQNLPWGMSFNGNFGVRMVSTSVQASGFVRLTSIQKTALYDPANRDAAAGISSFNLQKPVAIDKTYTDWLPSYNLALWVLDDKLVARYSWSKTVARPPVGRLWPAGVCTVDERNENEFDADGTAKDNSCDTFGNPDLKPYQAAKANTSLEWYPNRDTSLSLAYYRQTIRVGGPVTVTVNNANLFAGTGEVDPQTGESLDNLTFRYNTYVNGEGYTQSGWEFASKTAFTFLPWRLRYTGADFNVSTTKASNSRTYVDPITGEYQTPPGQYKYFANLALWYDDGKTNARITWQGRDRVFTCVSACGDSGVNNTPNANPINVTGQPYNPGEPYFT